MKIANINMHYGRRLDVEFNYFGEAGGRQVTTCNLFGYMDGREGNVGKGAAICRIEDVKDGLYSVEEGERLALTRALEDAGADREDRTLVWDAYNGTILRQLNRNLGVCGCPLEASL